MSVFDRFIQKYGAFWRQLFYQTIDRQKAEKPLLGSASHRFQLSVRKVISEDEKNIPLEKLNDLNEVALRLQKVDCILRQARAYFDSALDVYPNLKARLHANDRTVNFFHF